MKFTFSSLTILLALLWNLPAFGNTKFMHYCKYGALWQKDEVSWLKYVLKAESCEELTVKISKLKSYNEFLVPAKKTSPLKMASWTNEFPELIGLKYKYDLDDVDRILGKPVDRKWFFRELDAFDDFRNLTLLDFTVYSPKYNFCMTMYGMRYQIKTIVIDWSDYKEANECKFSYITPDIIMAGDFLGSGTEKIAENIIGMELYVGNPARLINYPNLRYVGVSFDLSFITASSLVLNQNITHLTINSPRMVEDIADLAELQNLAYLGLTCIKNERDFYKNKNIAPEVCDKPYLKDLSFVKNLTWLKSLNVSYSGLENVDELIHVSQLESLDISHNNIKRIPDFSSLKNLRILKANHNPGNE